MSEMNHYIELAKTRAKVEILPPQLASIRDNAINTLVELSIPTRKNEVWKYTNIKRNLDHEFKLTHHDEVDSKIFKKEEGFTNIFFHNGVLDKQASDVCDFEIIPLSQANDETYIQLIEKKYIGHDDISEVLNKALLKNGYIFVFGKNYQASSPILIHRSYDIEDNLNSETHFFTADKNSNVSILEKITNKTTNFINITNHINLAAGALFNLHNLQDCNSKSLVLQQINASVDRDAHFFHTGITLGAEKSRTQLYIDLMAENSFADAHGLYALHKHQHHDTSSYIHHRVAHTESAQLYKGILADSSRGVFTGKVRIDEDAQQVNAAQLNKNLLLSTKAQANSRPQLEIYADDVKCAHGSTTGQLSKDELFYFLARGIKEEKARQILAKAFANDVLFKIKDIATRDYLMNYLSQKHIEATHV